MPITETQKEPDAVLHYTERLGSKPPERNSIKRALDILFRSEATWTVIAQEEGGLKEAFFPYFIVIGFVPVLIGSLIGMALWGSLVALLSATVAPATIGMSTPIFWSVVHLVYEMVGILITAKIVELAAPSFGLRPSWVLSVRALVYGATPSYLACLLSWIPFLGWLVQFVCLLWSLRLIYNGLKVLLAKPTTKSDMPAEKPDVREPELASH